MFNKIISLSAAVGIIFWILMIAGCATPGPQQSIESMTPPAAEIAATTGWWYAQFRIHWPAEEPIEWHWDLLIADKIVAPVLLQYKDDIRLWRVHRRAVRDETGHQFSFIFYATAETAYRVFNQMRADELLAEMRCAGIIKEDRYDNLENNTRPRIEDTSDPGWPPAIQRHWPYYMMGASQMWLNLVSETVADMPRADSPLALHENEQHYKKAAALIDALWEREAQHAFLHHLSGLFGYQAITFYDKRKLQF